MFVSTPFINHGLSEKTLPTTFISTYCQADFASHRPISANPNTKSGFTTCKTAIFLLGLQPFTPSLLAPLKIIAIHKIINVNIFGHLTKR